MGDTEDRDIQVREFHRNVPEMTIGELAHWPLRVYTLGRFTIVRDGVPLLFERKAQKRPIELLQALIALGGRQVRQIQLEDAIWPNSPIGAAQKSFNVALHRLRKLIGPRSLLMRDGKLSLDPNFCWVDVWAFERQLGQIEDNLVIGGMRSEDLPRQVINAMALCQGPFLGLETEQDWMVLLREKLRHRVRRLFKEVGHCLGHGGHCQQVIAIYHKALELDPLAEEFYRRLMVCYTARGRYSESVAVYQSCKKVLHTQLKASPSPLTEIVLRNIRQQDPKTLCKLCGGISWSHPP